MDYTHKTIAVLGCGESGVAAAELLTQEGATVIILDSAERQELDHRIAYLERLGVRLIAGENAQTVEMPIDRGVLSPGISLKKPLVQNLLRQRVEMIGELELAYELCRCPVVAITGTNGKTTTTGLIAEMFDAANVKNMAGGNIGTPFSSFVDVTSELDVAVIEVSSFQLETIRKFRPKVSVWLNFAADHLDRYQSLEEYREAKLRIFENQEADDVAVVNVLEDLPPLKARQITFSALVETGDFALDGTNITYHGRPVLDMRSTRLSGIHNAENLMAALATGMAWGLEFETMQAGLCSYQPEFHRNETVGEHEGITYINDSKATNPSALERSLQSCSFPVLLIAGGKRKGFEFKSLRGLVEERVKAAVLIGEMADTIAQDWSGTVECLKAESLEQAVRSANQLAVPGDVVLLSPGTSSFDMFKSYGDRGDQFKKLVNNLMEENL